MEIALGTWTVRLLDTLRKVAQLDYDMKEYKWSVAGLAEVRWTGTGEVTTDDGHRSLFSREERRHGKDIGFLIHKDTAQYVMECKPVSSRLVTVGQPYNRIVVQVYAPICSISGIS